MNEAIAHLSIEGFVILNMNKDMRQYLSNVLSANEHDARFIITISNSYGDSAITVPGKDQEYQDCKKIVVHHASAEYDAVIIDIITKHRSFTHSIPIGNGEDVLLLLDKISSLPFKQWHVQTPAKDLYLKISPMTSRGQTLLHRFAKASKLHWPTEHGERMLITPSNSLNLLHAIGILDSNHAIIPAMRDKYVQINHFVRMYSSYAVDFSNPIRIIDCGCGQSYVSFALLWYLRSVKNQDVTLIGIDQRKELIDSCRMTAIEIGLEKYADFIESSIADWNDHGDEKRDSVIIALHACDTATDDALALALRCSASLILAAPCCHHFVQQQMSPDSIPHEESFLIRDGIMKERLGDMLTDSMRRDILISEGYSTDLIEFTPLEHTAKNVMIRAKRVNAMPHKHKEEALLRWQSARDRWHVEPKLAQLLTTRN